MSRRNDRRHAFNIIFSSEFEKGENISDLFDDYIEHQVGEELDKEFVYQEFSGTIQNLEKIDALITSNLKSWTLDRLNKTDLAILRLAVYEILFAEKIPPTVSINEAVELAKTYSDDEAPGFINGVLASILKSLGNLDEASLT